MAVDCSSQFLTDIALQYILQHNENVVLKKIKWKEKVVLILSLINKQISVTSKYSTYRRSS